MDEIVGLTQSIPSGSREIAIQLTQHERVKQHKVISCDSSCLVIECHWEVMLGSRNVALGISAKGVRAIEPVRWHIPFDFPEHQVFPFLRKGFPRREFPHIYPSKAEDFVRPCITEASITSYLLANGISSLLKQLDSWLDRAAQDSLMLEDQGWEPTIFDNLGGSFSDVNSILINQAEKEVLNRLITDSIYLSSGAITSLSEQPICLIASNDEPTGHSQKITIYHAYYPKSSASEEFQNFPVTNREELLAFASAFEINPELPESELIYVEAKPTVSEQLLLNLNSLDSQGVAENIKHRGCIVILYIPRSLTLIGGHSKIEVIPFFVRTTKTRGLNPEVIPLSYIQGGSQQVLQKLSHSQAREIKKISFLGAGSVGSKIALSLSRSGSYRPHIIDRAEFRPHNMARHGLTSIGRCEGWPKSYLVNMTIQNWGIESTWNSSNLGVGAINLPNDTDVIIESTGDEQVSLNLANQSNLRGRVYQVGLYGRSTMGYLAIEPASKKREVRIDDIEALLYSLSVNYEPVHKALFEYEGAKRQVVGHGCSSETTVIADTALNLVCAALTEKIDTSIYKKPLPDSLGELLLCFKADDSSIEWTSIFIPPTKVLSLNYNERIWEIRVSGLAVEAIYNYRKVELPRENGGAIIGHICELTHRIFITGTVPLSQVMTQTSVEYSINQKELSEIDESIRHTTQGRVYVLGTWHSHTTVSEPSSLDMHTLNSLNESFTIPVVTMLMCDGSNIKIVEQKNKNKG